MSGGKGGSTTSEVSIPEYIEAAAQRNLNKAERISQIGYTPYYGPDVAAFTPMQQAGFQSTADLAGAYGMAAPSSQQDIYGGMGPATQYANGVQGYSSAPMYEQSLAELGARRPGQKAYIDSFFIDPYSGGTTAGNFAPIDYTRYGTMAEAERQNRQNELNIAGINPYNPTMGAADPNLAAQPNPEIFAETPQNIRNAQQILATDPTNPNYNQAFQDVMAYQAQQAENNPYGQSTGFGITPAVVDAAGGIGNFMPYGDQQASSFIPGEDTAGFGTQLYNDLTEAGTGIARNTLAGRIFLDDSYNVGGMNNPVETPTVAEMIDATPTGMVYQPTTGGYVRPTVKSGNDKDQKRTLDALTAPAAPITSPRPISRKDAAGGADTGDDGASVLCTAYASMGYLPADIWSLDTRYGIKRFRQHPVMVNGYRLWAAPIARFIKTEGLAAKAVRAALWPIVRAWAEEMAHVMKPKKYSGNKFGKIIMAMGEPFSYAVGATFLKRNAQKEL